MAALPLVEVITALVKLGGKFAEKALELALDPTFNESLSPSAGLTVTPLIFSSIEQEGRWKVKDWKFSTFDSEERQLTNRILADAHAAAESSKTSSPLANPANAPVNFYPSVGTGAATHRAFGPLLTIKVDKPPAKYNFIAAALQALQGSQAGALVSIYTALFEEASAQITADWQHDGLEICGGFAGLTKATGFGSVFGHRANVQLSGTVYGNYLPASYLIGMSGYVNPVGPKYVEFRCAAVVQAGKPIQPLWGQQWDRDTGNPADLNFDPKRTGFNLSVTP